MQKLKGKKIKVKISKSLFAHKSIKIFVGIFVVIAVISYPLFKINNTKAEEVILYPNECFGDWENVEVVSGEPISTPGSSSAYVAKANGSGQIIKCKNFVGDLPEQANITKAELEFSWSLGYRPMKSEIIPLEQSYDPGATIEDISIIPEIEVQTTPEIEIKGESTLREEGETQPEEKTTPVEELEVLPPSSFLRDNFLDNLIKEARAEELATEASDILNINTSTSSEIANTNGTSLFDINYSLQNNIPQVLGEVFRERLQDKYEMSLNYQDIEFLEVGLISKMTIDDTSDLYLEAVKLTVTYQGVGTSIGDGPDLSNDVVIGEDFDDQYWAILIKKNNTDKYEIWYTQNFYREKLLSNLKRPDNRGVLEVIADIFTNESDNQPTNTVIPKTFDESSESAITLDMEPMVTEAIKPSLELITDQIKPALDVELGPFQENFTTTNNAQSEVTGVIEPLLTNEIESEINPSWNFVAGDDLVSEYSSIDVEDGSIFWLTKDNSAIYMFNPLTQSLNSQSYNIEAGDNYIIYKDFSGEEKKAIFDFPSRNFSFSKIESLHEE